MKTAWILLMVCCLCLCQTAAAEATGPLQALQTPIDKVMAILKNPAFKEAPQEDIQYREIRNIIDSVFDFNLIAVRSVGRYWKNFTEEEKQVFTDAFAELLSRNYIQKIQGEFKNESVVYLEEQALSADKYLVQTKIIRESVDVPVDYAMWRENNTWKIYDVNVEGVSLVKNYRTQFNKILMKESPAQLIERIKNKIQ